jgi:DNA gyrase/topoisomerase IV subunit B
LRRQKHHRAQQDPKSVELIKRVTSNKRTLRRVNIDSAAEADRVFSMLMGDEVPPRREFIEKNAPYANIDA